MTGTIQQTSQEAAAIRARSAQWLDAVGTGDAERVVDFYGDDAVFLVPNVPLAKGREAVRAVWTQLLGAPDISLSWTPLSVDVSSAADMAYEVGGYHLEMDGSTGRITDDGKYLVVWRRSGGVWRVSADMFNSSQPARA